MNAHPDIPPHQWEHILSELRKIETREDVKILFAVESGSRAWGFPSPDSDFDVRFVYARPRDWYLSLTPGRDVIELPLEGDDDINGWDIRKALGLALKPNPVLLEWLSSPIQYIWDDTVCNHLHAFTRKIAHGTACRHHYMRMTTLQRGDGETIKLKTYFYALRAAMALRWIDIHAEAPPMNFQHLMHGIDIPSNLESEIEMLLLKKKSTVELGKGPRIPSIEAFLDTAISSVTNVTSFSRPPREKARHQKQGDELFRAIIGKQDISKLFSLET